VSAAVRHEEGAESDGARIEGPIETECPLGRCPGGGCFCPPPCATCEWPGSGCPACSPAPVDSAAGFPVEGTAAPTASPLEAAWAKADRLDAESDEAAERARGAARDARAARIAASAFGPRPARVPS
jgi:hypothetical protein